MTAASPYDMKTVEQVTALIEAGKILSIAGDKKVLAKLPKGTWVGGTTPYFMAPAGGLQSFDKLFVTEFPQLLKDVTLQQYDAETITQIPDDTPEGGFSFICLPAFCQTFKSFAYQAPKTPGFKEKTIIGWVPGVHFDILGYENPAAYNGQTGERLENNALVLHFKLPEGARAEVIQLNLFEGNGKHTLRFEEDGFNQSTVIVDGEKQAFAPFIRNQDIDTRLPLISQEDGPRANISLQFVPHDEGIVKLYAPVFKGVDYQFASALTGDFPTALRDALKGEPQNVAFSCTCVLNYVYSELEGVKLPFYGPVTFGEIAHQLLNQTLVYLQITEQ